MRACVRACVRACARVCVCITNWSIDFARLRVFLALFVRAKFAGVCSVARAAVSVPVEIGEED